MSGRSWFIASEGQQEGPYSEALFREMIGKRTVTQATLVWSEGMSSWQRAGDVPGLLPGGSRPPTFRSSGVAQVDSGGALTAELDVWSLLGRALIFFIGMLLVIPAPWAATSFYRWFIGCLHVPQRSGLEFTGKPGDIWYVFVISGLFNYAGVTHVPYLTYILFPIQAYLSWMTVRWIVANISSEGRQLPLTFEGGVLTYVGWYVLLLLSTITIVGWAWVTTAWTRWMCRNIAGTRREIVFDASGWQVLWRTVVFGLCSMLIIPIPWILRWYASWYVSQFAVVEASA
jgi:hypothetical protein